MNSNPNPQKNPRSPGGTPPPPTMMSRHLSLCALLLLGASFCDAKRVSGRFHLDAGDETHGPEFEIAKFSFAVGASEITGKIKYPVKDMNWMTSPALYLFSDDTWDAYHKAPACMDKVEHAHSVIRIGKASDGGGSGGSHSNINYGYGKTAKNSKSTLVARGTDMVWSFEWKITHEERTKGWFLIAADCALEQYNTKVASMEYDVTLTNPGGNHLPADEMWLPSTYTFMFIVMLIHIGYCLNQLSNAYASHQKIHLVVKLLGTAYLLQLFSLLFEMIHLFLVSMSGSSVFMIDFLSELMEGVSGLVISFVLICLACGWTLVEEEADTKKAMSVATILRNPREMFRGRNLMGNVMIVAMLVLMVYVVLLIFWNKLGDDDFTKFHDSDTKHGKTLIQIRLGLFTFFGLSLLATVRRQVCKGFVPKFIKKNIIYRCRSPALLCCSRSS